MRYILCAAALALAIAPAAFADEHYLPRAVIAGGLKTADCDIPVEQVTELDPQDLGNGLKLVQVSCWRAAYNFGSILFAAAPDARDKARLLAFQTTDGKSFKQTYDLNLPEYDPKDKTLRSFFKGRGVGDCGSIGQWKWTGSEFKLTDYWLKSQCDGELFDVGEEGDKWRVYPPKK